ncbi:MAG: M48 family metallopeptidase [Mycoplasmoidaceae bacterium]
MKQVKDYIISNGKKINYIITYKDVSRISLRVRGGVHVTSPYYASKTDIINFLYENVNFINSIIEKKMDNEHFNLDKNIMRMAGSDYKIITNLRASKSTWKIVNNQVILNLKTIQDKEGVLKKVLKKKCEDYVNKRIAEISSRIKIPYNSVKVKAMTARWGHCDRKKNIVIAAKVIILEPEMIDYLLIHELCHVIEANHSHRFWNLVEMYCPNYKDIRKKMNQIGLVH